jgi:hypothetical protein
VVNFVAALHVKASDPCDPSLEHYLEHREFENLSIIGEMNGPASDARRMSETMFEWSMESCIIVPAKIPGFCHRLLDSFPKLQPPTSRRNPAISRPGFYIVFLVLAIASTRSQA